MIAKVGEQLGRNEEAVRVSNFAIETAFEHADALLVRIGFACRSYESIVHVGLDAGIHALCSDRSSSTRVGTVEHTWLISSTTVKGAFASFVRAMR